MQISCQVLDRCCCIIRPLVRWRIDGVLSGCGIREMDTQCVQVFIDGLYTKGTRAHMHGELIREWLWELTESSLQNM